MSPTGQTVMTDQVRAFLLALRPDLADIGLDDELIDSRILDSLAFVELFVFLEDLTGREVEPEDVTIEDLSTLRRIDQRFLQDVQ